jgi:hypothetical protein
MLLAVKFKVLPAHIGLLLLATGVPIKIILTVVTEELLTQPFAVTVTE